MLHSFALYNLADRMEKGQEQTLELGIIAFIRQLPDRFDREKAHERLRKLLAKHRLAPLDAKGLTDSEGRYLACERFRTLIGPRSRDGENGVYV